MQTPCKDCYDRYENCHAECEKYKEWRSELDSIREKIIDAKKRQKIILKAVDELPYKMRKVVVLFEFEDFTIAEIAKKLGEPEGTIKSRLFNARKVLAEKLKLLLGEN